MRTKRRDRHYNSSRLYLRNNDHREVILNDTYTNILWLRKKKDDKDPNSKEIDEPVWIKYPPKATVGLLHINNYYYIGNVNTELCDGHYDEFGGGQRSFDIFNLWDITIAMSSYTSTTIWVTEDGVLWKRVGYNGGDPNAYDPFPYANNYTVIGKNAIGIYEAKLVSYTNWVYDINTFVIKFYKDEETGEWKTKVNSTTKRISLYDRSYGTISTCGNTPNGTIFMNQYSKIGYSDTPYDTHIYLLDEDANLHYLNSWAVPSYAYDKYGETCDFNRRFAYNPSRTKICYIFYGTKGDFGKWEYNIVAYTTTDGGITWFSQLIDTLHDPSYYPKSITSFRHDICFRGGYFNFYYSDYNNNVHLYRSQDGLHWEEYQIGNYVDIRLEEAFGPCFSKVKSSEFIRLKFKNDSAYDSDIYPTMLFSSAIRTMNGSGYSQTYVFNNGNYNMCFQNGQHQRIENEDFLMFQIGGYLIYCANSVMAYDNDSWAVEIKSYDKNDAAETLQYGDYVGGFGPGDEEGFGSDLFIWEADNNRFVMLDQSTINFNDYPGYKFETLDKLPKTGKSNTIYVVKRKYDTKKIDQYIWNPDTKQFEMIQYTTYDMSKHNYAAYSCKQLPEVGQTGIVYAVPKVNMEEGYVDSDLSWKQYVWDSETQSFRSIEEMGWTYMDVLDFKMETVAALPGVGEDKTLYICADIPISEGVIE